mgnify:CR=1 FL=1|tara:strand:+ start:167 stop:1141 length:975 start_codon:yes stop_codon:yes gene_type:complete
MYNILFLCDKKHFVSKMARIRFHSMKAIGELSNLKYSGTGWEDYDNTLTVQENIDKIYLGKDKPDVVVAYEPLKMRNFADIEATRCIRFAEMYDYKNTMQEIQESKSNLIFCFHKNEMQRYQKVFKNHSEWPLKFVNISKCAEKTIFKDYQLPKICDILLVGSIWHVSKLGPHYPIRRRMHELLQKMPTKYKCGVFPHPGGEHLDAYTDRYAIEFARAINSSKMCVTCSGLPKTRFAKYVEISLCNTAVVGDIPDDDPDHFKQYVIEVDMSMSDEEIVNKMVYYLEKNEEREKLVQAGREMSLEYTQEKYAERFIKELDEYFKR